MIQPHLLKKDIDFLIPMLDARRMEVYTAIYDKLEIVFSRQMLMY